MNPTLSRRLSVYSTPAGFVTRDTVTLETTRPVLDAATAIQAALDIAGRGEVVIEPGDYPISRRLNLRSHLTLRGRGRGTQLLLTADNTEGSVIHGDTLDGVRVTDLTVSGHGGPVDGSSGIVLTACGDSRVTDVIARDFGESGIVLQQHCFFCEVRSCQLVGNRTQGILCQELAKGRVGDYLPNSIQLCSLYGGGTGIRADFAVVLNIVGCTVTRTHGPAYHLTRDCNSVLISGSRSFQITGPAVRADTSHELNITGNIFCWHTNDGIHLTRCSWGCISGNEIIDTGSHNPDVEDQTVRFDELPEAPVPCDGLRLEGVKGFSISGNTIFNWPQGCIIGHGVSEDATSFKNSITGNNINYFAGEAVASTGRETTVTHNTTHAPEPHLSTADYPLIQSFENHRLDTFIANSR
jgi:hypothetical protein